jgi:hypothetical protein
MFEFLKKLQKNGLEFKLSSKLVKLKGEVAELKLYYLGSWDSLDRVIRREINTFKSKKLEYYPKKDQLEFRVSKSLPTPTQTQAIKKL